MNDDTTIPQLFAFLPDGGAEVGVSDDHDTVAVYVDLDTHHDDQRGTHFIELSLTEALNLSTKLIGAVEKIVDHQETQRIAEQFQRHLQSEFATFISELDDER